MYSNFDCFRDALLILERLFPYKQDNIQDNVQDNVQDSMPKINGETQNTAKVTQGNKWGYDLVQMTTHSPTCALCSMYQGRVYATTREAANGKYKFKDGTVLRFPYLYDTAFSNGNNEIHPNCRHGISLFAIRAYTNSELRHYVKISNAPFEDTRSDEEKLRYDSLKAKENIKIEQRKMYERIKEVLPDDAPKSFSGFVKMENAKSEKYQKLIKNYYRQSVDDKTNESGIDCETLLDKMQKSYSKDEIAHLIYFLAKEKLIKTNSLEEAMNMESIRIYGITYEGRQLLNRIRSDIIWNTVSPNLPPESHNIELSAILSFATAIINEGAKYPKNTTETEQNRQLPVTDNVVKKIEIPTEMVKKTENNQDFSTVNLSSISPDWDVSISFGRSSSQNFDRAIYLAKQAPKYQEEEYNGKKIYQATYGKDEDQYLAFIQLYEMIKSWKSTTVMINGKMIDRKIIGGLNYCYGDKCRSGNADFCYGASFMTKNPFGCHRLQISACNHPWWTFSVRFGDYYFINKEDIRQRMEEYGKNYRLCPCFDENKINETVDNLPDKLSVKEYENLCRGSSLNYTVNVKVQSTPQGMPSTPTDNSLASGEKSLQSNTKQHNVGSMAKGGGCVLPAILTLFIVIYALLGICL